MDPIPFIRALFYGDTGAGKTYLIGTAQLCKETCPMLVLNARGQPVTFRVLEDPPLVLEVSRMKDFNVPYDWILGGQDMDWVDRTVVAARSSTPIPAGQVYFAQEVYRYFESRGTPPSDRVFRSIAIDGITWTQRVSLSEIVGNASVKPGDMPQATQIQHWGSALAQLTNLADLYYQLPIHVMLTALTRHTLIEAYGTVVYCPFIWGQSALEIPSLAELLGRLIPVESLTASQAAGLQRELPTDMAEAWNVLLTKGGRTFVAKWQGVSDNPEVMVAPTIQKIVDVLRSSA